MAPALEDRLWTPLTYALSSNPKFANNVSFSFPFGSTLHCFKLACSTMQSLWVEYPSNTPCQYSQGWYTSCITGHTKQQPTLTFSSKSFALGWAVFRAKKKTAQKTAAVVYVEQSSKKLFWFCRTGKKLTVIFFSTVTVSGSGQRQTWLDCPEGTLSLQLTASNSEGEGPRGRQTLSQPPAPAGQYIFSIFSRKISPYIKSLHT